MAGTQELLPLPAGSEVVSGYSRFNRQSVYVQGGEKFWGAWVPPPIPFSPSDTYHVITSVDESRIDLVAYRYYKTPELWWVIAEANGIQFPADELSEGTILRVPDLTKLMLLGMIQ